MRNSFFVVWVLLSWLVAGRSQAQSTYVALAKSVRPPGVVFVQDSLFMDEAEVTLVHWAEYLHFLQKDSSAAFYHSQLPDAFAVRRLMQSDWTGEEFALYNLRSSQPSFRNLPMVGIYYAQAVKYCRWRTAVVNKLLHSEDYLRKHPKLKKYKFRVEYRLPTVKEWELAAAGKLATATHPLGVAHPPVPGSREYKEQMCTAREAAACSATSESSQLPAASLFKMEFTVRENAYRGDTGQPFFCESLAETLHSSERTMPDYAYSHPPNAYGLYNMIGNVAELTATPGLAKGGSFEHSIQDFTLQTNFAYAQPQAWLGFRCACTVFISPKP